MAKVLTKKPHINSRRAPIHKKIPNCQLSYEYEPGSAQGGWALNEPKLGQAGTGKRAASSAGALDVPYRFTGNERDVV